jgi:Ca2+-binding EF-hand superfamily protein
MGKRGGQPRPGGNKEKANRLKAISSLQLKNVSAQEGMNWYTCFAVLDEDGDHHITEDQAIVWFRALGWIWSRERIANMMVNRQNDEGTFSFWELIKVADINYEMRFDRDNEKDMTEITDVYKVFDYDQHGSLMRSDLMKMITQDEHGNALPDDEKTYWSDLLTNFLDSLSFANHTVTFDIKELAHRTGDKMHESRTQDWADIVSSVKVDGQ